LRCLTTTDFECEDGGQTFCKWTTSSNEYCVTNIIQTPAGQPAPTRPRLQSVNQDFSNLNEQIRQVAHVIRLPDDWALSKQKEGWSASLQHVVCARAEWVLRWVLDKLKDDTEAGTGARSTPLAWQLLECMIHILPVSRSAPHLRDAGFTTILERTLVENFDKDLQSLSAASDDDVQMQDASESSETIHEDSQPSRKRKRGTSAASPSKRAASTSIDPTTLFRVVRGTLESITQVSSPHSRIIDSTQQELMKMVLRTETAQASRILKFWLMTVHKLLTRSSTGPEQLAELSVVLEIWEVRIVDTDDTTGSSSEDFANECLVPTLQLIEGLRSATKQSSVRALDVAVQALDRLLTRHVIAPSRAAFAEEKPADSKPAHREASALASCLNPLRALLLQSAQIEDAGEVVPAHLVSLFDAVPYLLDLAIRASPSKTPKARLAERPWIQAVFVSLSECAGCSLKTPPEFVTSKNAVVALQSALQVLMSHNISMHAGILKEVFWYHCGVKYPERGEKEAHWPLIAALIELDPSIFITEPRSSSGVSKEQPNDLTEFLFELISDIEIKGHGFVDDDRLGKNVLDDELPRAQSTLRASRELILHSVITPIMSAFSRNRNLLGFLRRWDDQLVRSYKSENRKVLKEKTEPIWEDRILTRALSELFEQSLTLGQITASIEEHAKRMDDFNSALTTQAEDGVKVCKLPAYKKASSSAVIIPAMLQSIQSDDTVAALRTQLHPLFLSYILRVRDDRYSVYTSIASSWYSLCQLMEKLWPTEMHASLRLQQLMLHPLIKQANADISTGRKSAEGRRVDSQARGAAMLFLFDACHRLQDVSAADEQVQDSIRKIVKCLSATQLEVDEHKRVMEVFCGNFIGLMNNLDVKASQKSFVSLLSRCAELDEEVGEKISHSMSEAVFAFGNSSLHNAFSAALSESLGHHEDSRLDQVTIEAIHGMQPAAMPRERREGLLDRLATLPGTESSIIKGRLNVMASLMTLPNATAKISTDGAVLFDMADQIQKVGLKSRDVLQSLQAVCQRTLGHIIPNQMQAQSRAFLAEYQKRLNSMAQSSGKVSPVGLAILRATILEQKDAQLLSIKQYMTLLKKCLTDDGSDADESASFEDVLDAFAELFPALLIDASLLKTTATWLRTWIRDNADLESYITSSNSVSLEVAEYVARLHKLIGRYKLFPDVQWLIKLTARILRESLSGALKRSVLTTTTEVLVVLETGEKLALVPLLTDVQDSAAQAPSYQILSELISTLPDKIHTDAEIKKKQLALLPRLCVLLAEASEDVCFNALLDGIITILNSKVALTSQHSIECVLSVLVKLTSRTSPALSSANASHIFARICETSRLILLVHRNKLGGRSHILLPLLQGLLFCLFMPTSTRSGALPAWLRSNSPTEPRRLTPLNASQYARLLATLCNPPQSSISKTHQHSRKSKDLNDPIKAARERTSHFLYPLLSSFCRFQLAGRLDPAVRVKLMPGIWEIIGTASVSKSSVDAMFAGMGRAEKDVWRGLWGEWEAVRGRRDVWVGGDDG